MVDVLLNCATQQIVALPVHDAIIVGCLFKAKATEIKLINDAISKNPAYIQLQSLEALKAMSKDPAAKLYFMDSNAPQPLPLMHLGDR